MVLTHGSLFTGDGGIDLGFHWAGFRTIWQVENNAFCNRLLAARWPEVFRLTDVRDAGKHNLTTPTILTGGFPCQPYSCANKHKQSVDDRILWPEMFRVIEEPDPAFVLAENVPGIGAYLDIVQADLETLGYETYPLRIPACAFGAAFLGERIYVVAASTSQRRIPVEIQNNTTQPSDRAQCNSGTLRGVRTKPLAPTSQEIRDLLSSESSRTPYGFPDGVDRLTALGNSVVPQIAEEIGRMILAAECGDG